MVARERVVDAVLQAVERGFLRQLNGERRALEDLRGPPFRRGHQVRERHHLVDQPDPLRLLGAEEAAGQQEPHRDLERQLARQPVDAAGAGEQADARLGQPEAGVVGGDDDVARERHLQSAADGDAVDRRDHRLRALEVARDAPERRPGVALDVTAVGRPLGGDLEIVARRERPLAGPGEDRDPDVGVVAEVLPDLGELEVRLEVQRVHHLGAVQRDVGDPPALLVGREPVAHPSTSSAAWRSVSGGPAISSEVTLDSRQASRSWRILSAGPISASSSTSFVGTAAAASSFLPSR